MQKSRLKNSFIAVSLVFVLIFMNACSTKNSTAPPTSILATNTSPPATTESIVAKTTESSAATTVPTASQALNFSDPVFEKLLKAELNKSEIFQEDLDIYSRMIIGGDHFISLTEPASPEESLVLLYGTEIEFDGQRYNGFGSIKSLADLVYFNNLTVLNISLQPNIDFATIPQELVSRLQRVFISQSQLKEIRFLAAATSLYSLSLSFGEVTDLSPLSQCKELLYLSGSHNPIEDLSPLADLPKLKSINLSEGKISDLSALANLKTLEKLELYANEIEDIAALAGLTNLKELQLIDNKIKDVSPLKSFTGFESLRFGGNPIENIEVLDHIENLEFD